MNDAEKIQRLLTLLRGENPAFDVLDALFDGVYTAQLADEFSMEGVYEVDVEHYNSVEQAVEDIGREVLSAVFDFAANNFMAAAGIPAAVTARAAAVEQASEADLAAFDALLEESVNWAKMPYNELLRLRHKTAVYEELRYRAANPRPRDEDYDEDEDDY